jgi:2-keto-4-pentenoate hydratase/2-oxohepta-3-ene-1,7-dioic acid hydratase in catechol pathway
MKLVSYRNGSDELFGRLVGDGIVDVTGLLGGCATVLDVLESGRLAELDEKSSGLIPGTALDEVALLPVIVNPRKILCAGLNYRAHRDEAGREANARPTIFTRFADSQIGAGCEVRIPAVVEKFDYEGELAAVIGVGGQHIPEQDAYAHVAGYSCYNDFSARDWQRHTGQWTPGKNFHGTGAFGPALVTADEVGAVEDLVIQTRVDGEVRQSATLGDLIFSVPELIAYISTFTALSPGDVIVTGTPGGVGLFREPPEFLRGGETVEVEISKVGLLRTPVRS